MAQLLSTISNLMDKVAKPPPPIIDRTLPQQPITMENLDEHIRIAKAFYKMDKKASDFNVAVVGAKGVGKSSLINALCNVRDDRDGAAPVGRSNQEPKAYRNSMMDALVLWEMPGAGVGHPSLTFFVDKKLYAFDLLLLVSDRFHRVDFDVARCASRLGRRLIFVRTKADVAVHDILQRSNPKIEHVNEAFKILRQEVEASFREGLRLCGLSDRWNSLTLFLVSAKWYLNGPQVYSSTPAHEEDEEEDEDEGGHKLDEDRLMFQITNLIRNRAIRRTRTLYRQKS